MLDDVLYPVHVGLLLLFVFFDLLKHLLVLCFVDLQFPLELLQLCPILRGLFLKLYLFLELLVAVALCSSFERSHYLWFSFDLRVAKDVFGWLGSFLGFRWRGHLLFWRFRWGWLFDLWRRFLWFGYWFDGSSWYLLRIGVFGRFRGERRYEGFEVEESSVDDSEGKICKNCENKEVKHR